MPKQAYLRTTRACKTCRSLKVRCLPSDQGDVCQKCVRSGAECVFEDEKPRRKREKPDSRARVAALESKLETLIAQVSNQSKLVHHGNGNQDDQDDSVSTIESANHSESRTSKDTPSTWNLSDQLPTPGSQAPDQAHLPTGIHERACASDLDFSRFSRDEATPEALLSQGFLSSGDIDRYIGQFRKMSSFFPFVIIPHDATVHSMIKDRPLLLHAALAVAASSEVHLQKTLEKSFKEVMLRKLVLESEKSIDLLQSILICVAWGHFFHIPKRNQSYQLIQMAFGLCVDLGLNLAPALAMQKQFGLQLDHFKPSGHADEDRFWSREARRAFLGCYHVSTMNSWIWAKPNTTEYTDYILQCAKSISENPEYSTDELILPLIQLQAVGDEYHQVLRVGRGETNSQTLSDRIGTYIRSFEKRMEDLKSTLTPNAASSLTVQLAVHFAFVHTYEQDLLSPFIKTSRLRATGCPMASVSSPIDSPTRIGILVDCLAAAVNYLDLFLNLPTSEYALFSTSQWSGLFYSTVMVYRLSIGTPRVPLWDVQVARDSVKLENYLNLMCERVQDETRSRLQAIVEHQSRDLYSVMGLVLQNVRNTYERLRRLPQAQSSTDEEAVHATSFPDFVVGLRDMPVPLPGPIFEQEQPRPGYQNRCPALQFWSTPESSNASADLLADDPFLNMGPIDEDDDGFWSQAFADMIKVGKEWGSGLDVGMA